MSRLPFVPSELLLIQTCSYQYNLCTRREGECPYASKMRSAKTPKEYVKSAGSALKGCQYLGEPITKREWQNKRRGKVQKL